MPIKSGPINVRLLGEVAILPFSLPHTDAESYICIVLRDLRRAHKTDFESIPNDSAA